MTGIFTSSLETATTLVDALEAGGVPSTTAPTNQLPAGTVTASLACSTLLSSMSIPGNCTVGTT